MLLMQIALNYYKAIIAYHQAGGASDWVKANPQAFDLVTRYWNIRDGKNPNG